MKFVWEVRALGGDPAEVRAAVLGAVRLLRGEAPVPGLSSDEQDYWRAETAHVTVSLAAHADGWTSVLITVALDEISEGAPQRRVAAVLSGGVDTAVVGAVMDVAEVTEAGHTDRLEISEP